MRYGPDREAAEARQIAIEEARAEDERLRIFFAEEEVEFLSVWTAELTAARRAAWNERQRAGEWYGDTETALGFDRDDLKRAIRLHAEGSR